MIPQSVTSSLDCCVIWLGCWTAAWWHHYRLNPPEQHGRWVRAEPLVSVVRLITTHLEEPNHWPEASFWRSSEKKDSRQKYTVGDLQPNASSLHSDCNRLYGFMFLMPGSIRQPQRSFFLVALTLTSLIQPTWIIFASVCGCVSAVTGGCDDGVMANGCVYSQTSPAFTPLAVQQWGVGACLAGFSS